MNTVSIVEYKEIDLSNSLLVIAFPSVGLMGSIAGSFIVKQLKLDEIGMVHSPDFLPVTIIHNGKPSPPVRLYASKKKCGPDGSCEQIAVVLSEFAPPPKTIRDLADALLLWAKAKHCKIILTLEGMQIQKKNDNYESKIFGVGSTPGIKQILKKNGVTPTDEGIIVGLSGVLLLGGTVQKQDIICMLAETQTAYPDSRAAARLLEKIDKFLPLIKIEAEPLYKEAEEIEKKITDYIQTSKTASSSLPVTPSSMYR